MINKANRMIEDNKDNIYYQLSIITIIIIIDFIIKNKSNDENKKMIERWKIKQKIKR